MYAIYDVYSRDVEVVLASWSKSRPTKLVYDFSKHTEYSREKVHNLPGMG